MEFTFSNKAKRFTYILRSKAITFVGITIVLGLVFSVLGIAMDHSGDLNQRIWSDLLSGGFLYFGVGIGALFFLALQYAAESGWPTVLKRVFEAVMQVVYVGMIALLLVFVASSMHLNHIYHWMTEGVMTPGNHHYDAIIAGKQGYLNLPFFWIRIVVYMATFVYFTRWFRKKSLEEDAIGGLEIYKTSIRKSAYFLLLFGVFSSTLSWDWLMSIDVHWFSTLFGWYAFSGMWLSAITMILIVTLYLKNKDLLPNVSTEHIHDLGKWLFALSLLTTYLWFSQFMLIWFSNIPEEVTYYLTRINEFKVPFFATMLVNFVLPIMLLMSADSKRNNKMLLVVALVVFFGRYMDITMMVMPGTMHHFYFGLLEIGIFLFLSGIGAFVMLQSLTKAPLEVKNHPFLEESIHHHV